MTPLKTSKPFKSFGGSSEGDAPRRFACNVHRPELHHDHTDKLVAVVWAPTLEKALEMAEAIRPLLEQLL